MARKLIVMPDDTIEPILTAIGAAAKSLRIKMFSVSDRRVLSSLVKAHKRKVKIRVLLNPARHSGEIQNRGARAVLLEAGIDVLDTNPAFAVARKVHGRRRFECVYRLLELGPGQFRGDA